MEEAEEMKILFVSPRYYPYIGGVEYVVKSIAERLTRLGHEVTVLSGDPRIRVKREEELNGVYVIRWPTYTPGDAYYIPRRISSFTNMVKELVKSHDVLHIHNVHTVLLYFVWKSLKDKRSDIKVCITPYYHGKGHTPLRSMLWKPWRLLVKKILKESDVVHTVSKLEARLVEKDFGVNAVVIENGVEEYVLKLDWKPEGYVLYSGRIERYKNIHRLVRVVHLINKKYDRNLKLIIVGDGPYRRKLLGLLKNIDIDAKMLPFQPYMRYLDLLSHAEFLGLLSEKESYPQSVNEANAIGTPVVIAEPWGSNFSNRTRTLVLDTRKSDEVLASQIWEFMGYVKSEPKSKVPSWSDVALKYLNNLYL